MTSKVTVNHLMTGEPGLDELLGGGMPEFSFNLIAGRPGCGKTTLAGQSVQRNAMVRQMEIMKMRGQPPLPGLHSFRIGGDGLHIVVPVLAAPPLSGNRTGSRASMDVQGLDETMDGGLPRGYSLLLAGPSGSGKSILAAAFLNAGLLNDETSVVATFERRAHRVHNELLAQAIRDGRLGVAESHALNLSIEESMQLLSVESRRLDAKHVVIDALSGFELALEPSFKDDFREALLRLVTSLAGMDVTVLMTSAPEDRYTDLRFSPCGTASMTDAVIAERYIEVGCRLRRVLAVVKVRDGAHSDQLREYGIDDDGIHIGATLAAPEGLLGGRPTTRAAGAPARQD